jgi:hypothetical protein
MGEAITVKALGFAPMSACADLTTSFIELQRPAASSRTESLDSMGLSENRGGL